MREFPSSEARRRLAALLQRTRRERAGRIRRRDGRVFVLGPERPAGSPLDVPAIEAGPSREEILDAVREGCRPA
ncbi:MAG TPA: hypothetical protein VNK43_11780 [Gemmatimonadales bacterium]|nr:hypothetical protein [Gemmatimonadales bacterium]